MEVGPGWDLAFVPLGLLGEGGYVEGGIDHTGPSRVCGQVRQR